MDVYTDAPRWVVRGTPRPGAPRLFCFPHGGGSPAEYVRWAGALTGVEVHVLHLPGRGARLAEPPLADLESLVDAVVDRVALGPGRFAFFGHSLGALVAYEVTRALRALGRPLPEHLVVSGFPAPPVAEPDTAVHELPDAELVAEVARRHGGVPPEVLGDPVLRAMVAGPLRADHRVLHGYRWRPSPPLDVPITAYGGREDRVTEAELRAWADLTTGPTAVRMFPGGHFYLRERPAPVLRALSATLLRPGAVVA
jgi:surfactin synthase thioesterase subunit